MKKIAVTFFIFLILSACSSSPYKNEASNKNQDQIISTTFTDEGIKISYTPKGKLDSIEVYGQAEIWKGNV